MKNSCFLSAFAHENKLCNMSETEFDAYLKRKASEPKINPAAQIKFDAQDLEQYNAIILDPILANFYLDTRKCYRT